MRSRRPPDADERPPDYSHRFHAGNVGDVWKHCVLVAMLRALPPGRPVRYLDTHAGDGGFVLGPTGEWTAGIGRVWQPAPDDGPALDDYRTLCRRLAGDGERPQRYPGSPAFAAAVLGPSAQIHGWERDPAVAARCTATLAGDGRVAIRTGDGLAALPDALAGQPADEIIVLIDPPYTQKQEWLDVPRVLAAAARARPSARFLLWYPVKSLTRPNAMHAQLAAAGVAATIAELITTPLELQRNRLNGSGLVLVRPPAGLLPAIAAAATAIGARCATHGGAWTLRMRTWEAARDAG